MKIPIRGEANTPIFDQLNRSLNGGTPLIHPLDFFWWTGEDKAAWQIASWYLDIHLGPDRPAMAICDLELAQHVKHRESWIEAIQPILADVDLAVLVCNDPEEGICGYGGCRMPEGSCPSCQGAV